MTDRKKEREIIRKKKKRASRRKIIILMIMIISLVIGNPLRNYISLRIENHRLRERNEQLIQRSKLKEEYKNIDNREYVEKLAREKLRLANPEEIIFIFPEGENKINITTDD